MPYIISGIRRWTEDELTADAEMGRKLFRDRRVAESREDLAAVRIEIEQACRTVIPVLHQVIGARVDQDLLARLVGNKRTRLALRCVGTPPVSDDDLDTLVDGSVNATAIRRSGDFATAVAQVLRGIADQARFPWIVAGRPPTDHEIEMAILATTTLAAASTILTGRRGDERAQFEKQVHDLLGSTLELVAAETISKPRSQGPQPGQFMKNAVVGAHGADAVVGLYDDRLLCIECKASNSEINSRKRLNKEVVADATDWLSRFGGDIIVPAAAIRGVFKQQYLKEAQDVPIALFWSHRLTDLTSFIESTRSPASGSPSVMLANRRPNAYHHPLSTHPAELVTPFSKVNHSPVGSAATGSASSRSAHRSLQWLCEAERSFSSTPRHLNRTTCGVMRPSASGWLAAP